MGGRPLSPSTSVHPPSVCLFEKTRFVFSKRHLITQYFGLMTHFHAVKVSETMGIREVAMYPSGRAGETIWCTGDILAILPILVWQFRASKCGYLLCEHVSSQKRYAVLAERKKAKSTRCRTSDALNPLSVIMVDC